MMRWTLRFVLCAAAVVACTLVIQADDKITAGDAELQFQLGNLLSDETRFREALDAFDRAIQTDDHDLQVRARAGKVKTALRIAEYDLAQTGRGAAARLAPSDPEALSLYADSLWSGGLFDEADDRLSPGAVDQHGIVTRALRDGALARHAEQARGSADRGAGGPRHGAARRRDPRRDRRRSTSGCIASTKRPTPTTTSSTCCRTRTAATRRTGPSRR